jgi:guanylate kinase
MSKKGVLFVISAPSGAGKTSVVEETVKRIGQLYNLKRAITYTTKRPRIGDIEGADYYFIDQQEFFHKISQNFFIEWSTAYGNYYGSARSLLQEIKEGASYIIILDRQGAQAVKQAYPEAVLVWMTVPSIETLRERLRTRGTENTEEIEKRLRIAAEELRDEEKKHQYAYTIVNDSFDRSVAELEQIVKKELSKK